MDGRRKDTIRKTPESRNKIMGKVEETLDQLIDSIATYIKDDEGKSRIFEKIYRLVNDVNRLND